MTLPRKIRPGRKAKSLQKRAQDLKKRRDKEKRESKMVAIVAIGITSFFLIGTLFLVMKSLQDFGYIHIPVNLLIFDILLIAMLTWVIYDWAQK